MMGLEKGQLAPPLVVQPYADKPKRGQKYVQAAGISLITVLIIVAGFVAGFYYIHKTSALAITTRDLSFINDGERVTETMDKFSDDVYKYNVQRSDGAFTVVEDYSRRIVTLRTDEPGSQHCLVLPLNREQKEGKYDDNVVVSVDQNNTERITYELDEHLIKNHDLLSDVAQEMCEGYPLYWGIPSEAATGVKGSRSKRDIHCTGCRCYGCGCGSVRCYCRECHRHISAPGPRSAPGARGTA